MTVTTETVSLPQAWLEVPLLYPPVGLTADREKDELKEKFPEFVPGKKRTVKLDLETAFFMLTAANKHFGEQAELAKNWMRRVMGDAQFAVGEDGRHVASRRFTPKTGYYVDPRIDDSIVKARGR